LVYKKYLPTLILIIAALALLAGLLPGGLSPAGVLKFAADRLVADGDFETIDAAFYNRLRPALLAGGVWLLGVGVLLRRGLRRWAAGLAGAGGLVLAITAGNLAVLRLESPLYLFLLDPTQTATATEAVFTPTPTLTPTGTPVPTEVSLGPGHWEPVVTGLGQPTVLADPGDGSGRLFVGVRLGLIRVIRDGALLPAPFLDLRDRVLQEFESLEQGLLGLVFHPQFAENGYFYVNYIDPDGNTVLSRFSISADDPNRADPDSEHRLLGILQPDAIHNAGHIVFGPDGYLYISSGDGGPQRDPFGTAQSLDVMLGKLLRIDVDAGEPYGIPPDNPFVGSAGLDEIYAFGMRNPWRFSFDALTGDLYIGEVGYRTYEEVNFIPAGEESGINLGWSRYEGFEPIRFDQVEVGTPTATPPPPLPDYTPPIWTYEHGGGRCAVVGGYVYRGAGIPELEGIYIYGDYCTGDIWGLHRGPSGEWVNEFLYDTTFTITSFGVDAAHELYVLTFTGEVFRLVP